MSSYDVVVVGAGTAGCVLAARLTEDPARRVCLVEAGPDYGAFAEGRWPRDLLDARTLAFSHSWETDREDRSQLRARVVGGCSAHNACVVIAGAPADYDEWGPGWAYAELQPYLERARVALDTRVFALEELSPWHRAFADAVADPIVHEVNAKGTVRWHAGFAYLDPARRRPNLTILADALADRVLIEGSRAVGIATSRGDVRATVTVLACGAYGSPGVLLRSGIGPDGGLPVGEGLLDHVGIGVGFEPTDLLGNLCDRQRRRPRRPRPRDGRAGGLGCVDHAHDPEGEHEPEHGRDRRANRGDAELTLSRYHRAVAPPTAIHFTGDDEADALLAAEPLALLIGFALDQQVPVQTAFSGPLKLKQRLGTLDAAAVAATDPGRLEEAFRQRPAIHRFPGSMARRVQELCAVIADEYGGDAARVWKDAGDGADLRKRIGALPGFGPMKITALGSVLAKRFGVSSAQELVPAHPTLGDVDSAQALADYQAKKRAHKAARRAQAETS